jgi:Rrf2 family protein
MKLTTKCRYGARAIYEIARNFNKRPTKRKEIVENQDIPDSYLENILISLKSRGIIGAIRGPSGGFVLKRDPASITMLDVVLAFENSLAPVDCIEEPSGCDRVQKCPTRPVWKRLQKAQEEVLREVTIQELLEKSNGMNEPHFDI